MVKGLAFEYFCWTQSNYYQTQSIGLISFRGVDCHVMLPARDKIENKKIKLHLDKSCDFRAKVEVAPSLSEAHRSLKEVVRMDIDVFSQQKNGS